MFAKVLVKALHLTPMVLVHTKKCNYRNITLEIVKRFSFENLYLSY